MRVLYKPLIAAAFGAAGSKFWYPRGAAVLTPVGNWDFMYVMGFATGVSSFVTDTLHEYVFPSVGLSEKMAEQVSATTALAASAAVTVGTAYAIQPDIVSNVGVLKLASVGVLAEVASNYIFNNYLE